MNEERVNYRLDVQGVHSGYGSVRVLGGVDVHVDQGEIVTLVGANGVGKSTLMMTICGAVRPVYGSIIWAGQDISRLPVHRIAHMRIAQVPEGRRVFSSMTVLENLQMGAAIGGFKHFEEDLQYVFELFPILARRQNQRGGTLSGGEQQMLAIGRALMSRPRLLLLDEPSLGLAPLIIRQIFEIIQEIRMKSSISIFLVEQNVFHALRVADRAYVMVNGRISMQGTGQELLRSKSVQSAYLGGVEH